MHLDLEYTARARQTIAQALGGYSGEHELRYSEHQYRCEREREPG
jgi:hypothetical protein